MNQFANFLSKPTALACAGACLLLVTAAQAEENSPYYVGATGRVTRNSNVLSQSVAQADTIQSAGLQAGLDQSFGRQRLQFNLSANHNRFSRISTLNHTDYALAGQLNWETIENFSGVFNVGANQSRYVDASSAQTGLNLLRSKNIGLQVTRGELTALTFDGGISASQNRYSAVAYQQNNLDQVAINGGVHFRPMGGVRLGTSLRHTSATYPNYSTGKDTVSRNDFDLTASARVTGASELWSRLSLTRESHSAVRARDYSDWTGTLSWTWRPTGKLKFKLDMNRDSNVGATDYLATNLISLSGNDSRISNKLGVTADWELTSMLSLNAGWSETWRTLDNAYALNQNGVATSTAKDRTTIYSLGVRYVPVQSIELGCSVAVTDRSTSEAASSLTYPYKQNITGCYGSVQLR
jgi:hypothetical protein